jgi:hypothetical protein
MHCVIRPTSNLCVQVINVCINVKYFTRLYVLYDLQRNACRALVCRYACIVRIWGPGTVRTDAGSMGHWPANPHCQKGSQKGSRAWHARLCNMFCVRGGRLWFRKHAHICDAATVYLTPRSFKQQFETCQCDHLQTPHQYADHSNVIGQTDIYVYIYIYICTYNYTLTDTCMHLFMLRHIE